MDISQRRRIDQWVEDALYHNLEQLRAKGSIDVAALTALTPLIQLYQTQKLESIEGELNSLWHLLVDGDASVMIRSNYRGLDVNITELPQEKPPQAKKKPVSPRPSAVQRQRQNE